MSELRRAQYLMGTTVEIVAYADESTAGAAVGAAFDEFERLERAFNPFDPASELARVNRSAAAGPVEVSEEVFGVVARGLEYCERSEGCFSIALGPVARLWVACAEEDRLPTEPELDTARASADYREVRLDPAARTVSFGRPGMALDLGGLVKGYAVDLAREALGRNGVERAYVSAGESSIAAFERPGDAPWRVGVRHPADVRRLAAVVSLSSQSISTSGTYERGSTIRGRWFSHMIDPRTGLPVEEAASATAVCASGEWAEVASKLLLLRGCERGIEACDALGWSVEGATVRPGGDTGVYVEYSSGLQIEVLG